MAATRSPHRIRAHVSAMIPRKKQERDRPRRLTQYGRRPEATPKSRRPDTTEATPAVRQWGDKCKSTGKRHDAPGPVHGKPAQAPGDGRSRCAADVLSRAERRWQQMQAIAGSLKLAY